MKIPFEKNDRRRYFDLLDQVFDSNFLSEGAMVKRFEAGFADLIGPGVHTLATANAGLGLMALLEAADVAGGQVIVPSNTFMATALAAERSGAEVILADCNRDDLCLSLAAIKKKVTPKTKAVVLVHIGGHLGFETPDIAHWLAERDIPLIEDCAHAHGASLNGRSAGTFGLGGAYSFYATKTMPLGEGGMVVTTDRRVADFVRTWRNYGKFDFHIKGLGARMNEVTAALGLVQLDRLPAILAWKRELAAKYDQIFANRVMFPPGMISGYYKYIVFDTALKEETGKVFDTPCHRFLPVEGPLPETEWVSTHHACPPMYYGWDGADLTVDQLAERLLA